MNITTDITTVMQQLGAYSYASTTNAEVAQRLQTLPGSAADKIFSSIELLYAHRDLIGEDGLALLGQLTGYAVAQRWEVPGQIGRLQGILDGVKRDTGEPGTFGLVSDDPEPVLAYRADATNWKEHTAPDPVAVKANKWEAAKKIRQSKLNGTATTPFGLVQIDESSRVNITGLVTMASLAKAAGKPFSEVFTLADNSVVTLDADKMIGLGISVGRYIAAVYGHARELRAQIDAATDVDVDINANWP